MEGLLANTGTETEEEERTKEATHSQIKNSFTVTIQMFELHTSGTEQDNFLAERFFFSLDFFFGL